MNRSAAGKHKTSSRYNKLKYGRVLLKISGELLGRPGALFDQKSISYIVDQIIAGRRLGARIALVIGAGNILRGRETGWLDKVDADTCGMTATIINGIILQSAMSAGGLECRISSGLRFDGIADRFSRRREVRFFDQGGIPVFVAGTGNPLFTTDTAAALRSIELGVDILIKATKVDGVFSADPAKHRDAVFYRRLSFREAISKKLGVMDLTAFNICREHGLPIYVYNLMKFSLVKVLTGKPVGTLVSNGGKINDR